MPDYRELRSTFLGNIERAFEKGQPLLRGLKPKAKKENLKKLIGELRTYP